MGGRRALSDGAAPHAFELAGVSRRELDVLEALGERLSNTEIAARLYVSVRTVESHVASLMRKLGVAKRRELTRLWANTGMAVALRSRLPPVLELLADPARFVGRDSERARLVRLWRRARHGQLVVALVVGEAGIGKSRLIAEFAIEVQQDGGHVHLGSCFEDLGLPYEPFVQVIAAEAARVDDSELAERAGAGARMLAKVVPELASRLDVAGPPTMADGQLERARVLSALHGYLCAMARAAPQLVVIEDLHWSTVTTRDAMRHICRTGAAVPLLVVVTCRDAPPDLDELLAAFVSDLSRQPAVELIALSGLSEQEIGGLLATTDSVRSVAEVCAATDGNPLLALEMARTGSAMGPTAALLAARFERLARAELDVLDVAVVVGAEFDAPLVVGGAGRTVVDTVKALEAAESAGLVTALPGRPGRFRFVHSLFRTVRYDSLPVSTRLRLHQSVAGELRPEADDERMLPALALHACAAAPLGDAAGAADLARRAGRLARRRLALDEAAHHFRQALAMLDLVPSADHGLWLHLQIDLGEVEVNAGLPEGRARLFAAIDEARRQSDHQALVDATLALSRMGARLVVPGHGDPRVAAAIRQALATIPTNPARMRARLLAELSYEVSVEGDVDRARQIARLAIAMARRLDDLPTLGHILMTYRFLIYEPAHAHERHAVCNELIELGRRLDEPTFVFAGLSHLFTLHREAGDFNRMVDIRAQLDELGEINLSPFGRMHAIARTATDKYIAGDLTGAETTIQQLTPHVEAGTFDALAIYSAHIAAIRLQQGRIVEFLPILEQLDTQQPFRQAVLVMALARAGRLDDATKMLMKLAARTTTCRTTTNGSSGQPPSPTASRSCATGPSPPCCSRGLHRSPAASLTSSTASCVQPTKLWPNSCSRSATSTALPT